MGGARPEFAAELRKLPLEERMRRARALLDQIKADGPDPKLRGKSMEDIVQMVKRTREEMAKERLAAKEILKKKGASGQQAGGPAR